MAMNSNIVMTMKAEALGKSLENLGPEVEESLKAAVGGLAQSAYAEAIRLANERLHSTRQDYTNALTFENIGENIYVITLHGQQANALEDGYASFDMKPGLLNGPKSKVTKKGTRYNTVPFYYKPNSQAPMSQKVMDMRDAVKKLIQDRNIDRIIKDQEGKPLQGVVARLYDTGIKNLEGLVKIQKTYEKTTQSTFMTFRRVSSKSPASAWIHPGFSGIKVFPDVERFINEELDRILQAIL